MSIISPSGIRGEPLQIGVIGEKDIANQQRPIDKEIEERLQPYPEAVPLEIGMSGPNRQQ